MKKIILVSLVLLLACAGVRAQNIAVRELKVTENGEIVTVIFRADIPRKMAKSSETIVFVPVLRGGDYSWSLPAIVVEGRRARIANRRHDWASEAGALQPDFGDVAVITENGSTVAYSTSLPWQPWMDGADLTAEMLAMRCCDYTISDDILLAEKLSLPAIEIVKPEPVAVEPEPTTGDKLAEEYTFIAPYSAFERLAPGQLFDDDRENTLIVYFRQGKYDVEPRYETNARLLEEMVSSIRTLQSSADSRVRAVVIAGFASPEGSFALNDRLAFDRAAAVKNYILEQTGLPDEDIKLYNGSEDWRGLKIMVEQSAMPSREAVLRIIDTVPVWDSAKGSGREEALMAVDGGVPYKYMYDNFFPLLRNAAYIKIYYDNK
jgi:outer membrane protein OmpA-like peptidoglycan-associated protein